MPAANPLALVTGATRGIGAAVAQALHAAGAELLVAARDASACAASARSLGGRALPLVLDVTDPAAVAALPARVRELTGRDLDWLVNNAGIALSAPLLPRAGSAPGPGLFEQHLLVNFHGPRWLCEAFLPGMLERAKRGATPCIVQLASSAGLRGYAYVAAYCASKHALVGYTRAAALELPSSGPRMHALCPHYVASPMLEQSIARVVAKTGRSAAEAEGFFAAQNPGGRLITPQEVAAAVLALLQGPEASGIFELDGGAQGVRKVP